MPATSLSPQRQRLAAAIERHATGAARVDKIRTARTRSWSFVAAAADRVEAAEAALAEAQVAAERTVVARLMGDDAPLAVTVAEATAILADARAGLIVADKARDTLVDEQDAAARNHVGARMGLDAAIGEVVRAECLDGLFAEFDAALDRVSELRALLNVLPGLTQRQLDHAAVIAGSGSGSAAARYRVALARLETDAAAALPDGLGDDTERAAVAA